MQMPTDLLLELRDTFNTFFNEDSLNEFALALGIDYENLPGSGKSAKARELALHLWRHSLLTRLAEVGPKRRPDIDWIGLLNKHIVVPGQTKTKVDHTGLQMIVPILAERPEWSSSESRKGLLIIAGVAEFVTVDLSGGSKTVAINVLGQLNAHGRTAEGDTALGRLLSYLVKDKSLPGDEKSTIQEVIQKYQL
jgi:hypothetical protein